MKYLITFLTIINSLYTYSQCEVQLYSHADALDADAVIGTADSYWWVCDGIYMEAAGINMMIYAEKNVQLQLNDASSIDPGGSGTIYIKSGGDILVNSDGNTIYHEPSVTILDNGSNNTFIECDVLTYDYSKIVKVGCWDVSVKEQKITSPKIDIFPNPTTGLVNIDAGLIGSQYEVYSLEGKRMVVGRVSSIRLNLEEISTGTYLLLFKNEKGVERHTLLIE